MKENQTQMSVLVTKETKERFKDIKRKSPFKNDMFINYLLDLYEKEQGGKDNDK